MRCTGYCTASNYDMTALMQFLQTTGTPQLHRDAIHNPIKDEKGAKRDIFYFSYGVVVFWGFFAEEERNHLKILKKFEQKSLSRYELDEFSFIYGDKMRIEEDEIALQKKDPFIKLAVSYAIAQSLKLTVFEETIAKTVEETKHLPTNLAQKGKISLSRRETSKKMG
ncbi:MAG TPA: RMD1 family protein, partial [Chlamydiales bacterium]|nr:RMD1 family protein [Chlamydiales bacterium]